MAIEGDHSSGAGEHSDALVLLSGGIDSAALLGLARSRGLEVRALHVTYGQAPWEAELRAAQAVCGAVSVPLAHVVYEGSEFGVGEIRGRNAFLLTIALLEFSGPRGLVLIGIHGGTEYVDCSPRFVSEMQRLYELHTGGVIEVEAPFINLLKGDLIRLAQDIRTPIEMTHSCEAANTACGACQSCVDRERLLAELSVDRA
jgi:7-cyano-7-deazaguanine synthase